MTRLNIRENFAWLMVGALGVSLAYVLFAPATNSPEAQNLDQKLQRALAAGSYGTDNLTLSTCEIDGGIEAVFALDHLTHELTGYVINPTTGKFFVKYNLPDISQDLNVDKTKAAKYTMVTGRVQLRPGGGGQRFGGCAVYVAEEGSGGLVAYVMPWNPAQKAGGAVVQQKFVKLDQAATGSGTRRPGS